MDLYLKVPVGTQILEEDNKTLLFDFKNEEEEFVVAIGGRGGLGNTNHALELVNQINCSGIAIADFFHMNRGGGINEIKNILAKHNYDIRE